MVVKSHERFRTGLLLAFVGGFLDAYTYLTRGGVFANAQTGNMVLLAVGVAEGNLKKAAYYLIPILAFAIGVYATEWIKKRCMDKSLRSWEERIIIVEIILLALIGFLPKEVPNAIVNVSVSFICSLQVNTFRKVGDLPYASTMCTGNLRSAMEKLFRYFVNREKKSGRQAVWYFAIILLFIAGAAVSAVLIGLVGEKSIWSCCVVLGVVLTILLYGNRNLNKLRKS